MWCHRASCPPKKNLTICIQPAYLGEGMESSLQSQPLAQQVCQSHVYIENPCHNSHTRLYSALFKAVQACFQDVHLVKNDLTYCFLSNSFLWMLFMERPLTSYRLLMSLSSNWNLYIKADLHACRYTSCAQSMGEGGMHPACYRRRHCRLAWSTLLAT